MQVADLLIKTASEERGFVLNADDQKSIVHTMEDPNVPLNTGSSTPTQAGGVYDVRDSSGDKAITHLDWSGGEGQKSLDSQDASYSRFLSSDHIDTAINGQISCQRPLLVVPQQNSAGPVFSALDKLWMGLADGTLIYSIDNGVNWLPTAVATPPVTAIGGFASDGTNLYFCCSGTQSGVWKWDGVTLSADKPSFTRFAGISAAIEKLAYNNGTLYGATGQSAGVISTAAAGTFTSETPAYITGANSTVAFVSTQNAVYWVVSKGGNSYVYRLWDDAGTVYSEQFSDFPTGFIATCAVGYLGNVDVGGYFQSAVSGVGQGAVYRTTGDGEMSILFRIGDRPEDTVSPADLTNDNRIRAAIAGSTDTFWVTERAIYRWDLRSGGYVHMGDFPGIGMPSRVVTQAQADTLPTGGDEVKTVGEYRIHIFKTVGSFNLDIPQHRDTNGNIVSTVPMDLLLVAGGAGGGVTNGGGGGAGGVIQETGKLFSGNVTVTIGAGGAAGANGSDSKFVNTGSGDLTAVGGGKGGSAGQAGSAGGSGGGAGIGTDGVDELGGTFTANQGNEGGGNDFYTAGGGWGASGGGGGAGDGGESGSEEVPV